MSRNVCSIYKYTVGMLYAEGREKAEKGDVVKRKKEKKKRAFKSYFVSSNADQNHQSCENGKKKGEGALRCVHHYHFERARAMST